MARRIRRLIRGRTAPALRRGAPRGEAVCRATCVAVGLCALSFGVSGCVKAPEHPFPNARAAIDRMYETGLCSSVLSGEGKLDYFGQDGRVRVTVLYLVGRPKSVRLDFVSPLGGTLATLTSDGTEFALLDRASRQYASGPAEACNVQEFLHVPVPPEALVQILSGEAPVLAHEPGSATIAWEDDQYALRVIGKHGATQQIWLEPHPNDWDLPWEKQRVRVTRVRVLQAGSLLYEVDLSAHREVRSAPRESGVPGALGAQCAAEVPARVQFRVPASGQDVLLEQQIVEHNPPVDRSAFVQVAPAGVSVRAAKCRNE